MVPKRYENAYANCVRFVRILRKDVQKTPGNRAVDVRYLDLRGNWRVAGTGHFARRERRKSLRQRGLRQRFRAFAIDCPELAILETQKNVRPVLQRKHVFGQVAKFRFRQPFELRFREPVPALAQKLLDGDVSAVVQVGGRPPGFD